MGLKERIKSSSKWKLRILNLMVNPVKTRPRLWLRMLRCFYIKRGRKSVIYSSVRMDVVPFNLFKLGSCSVIESFSCLNNMVGVVEIGEYTRIGLGNTVIGPVKIGNHVNLAQGVVISALNHNYTDVKLRIDEQGVSTSQIEIEDDVWIGANAVVVAGIHIGRHSVVAGGSVVTRNIPSFSVVAGSPARIIKRYNTEINEWERV